MARTPRIFIFFAAFLLLTSCDDSMVEDNRPGDCSDGIDNDDDGLIDCDDSDCLNSVECDGDDDET